MYGEYPSPVGQGKGMQVQLALFEARSAGLLLASKGARDFGRRDELPYPPELPWKRYLSGPAAQYTSRNERSER
jgi:hypothetical protein